jgi:hypothetical protein
VENRARFFFDAAAVLGGAGAQAVGYTIVDVVDDQLSHDDGLTINNSPIRYSTPTEPSGRATEI